MKLLLATILSIHFAFAKADEVFNEVGMDDYINNLSFLDDDHTICIRKAFAWN